MKYYAVERFANNIIEGMVFDEEIQVKKDNRRNSVIYNNHRNNVSEKIFSCTIEEVREWTLLLIFSGGL